MLDGKAKADYAKCVDIATTAAINKMVLPGALAVFTPIIFGLVLGQKEMLGGILAGVTVTCLLYTSPSPRDQVVSRMPSSA